MKISVLIFAALLVTFSVTGQQQQPANKQAQSQLAPVKLTSQADTLQYTLGAFIGQWLGKNGFSITNQTLFKRGMDDVLQNRTIGVNDTNIVKRVAAYQLSTMNERNKLMEEQLFAALKGKTGVGALPDGVHYIVLKNGTGIRPALRDSIEIGAVGIFPDGTVFEDTFQKKKSIVTLTGSLIPGLSEAIQLMPEGSQWRIFIPSALAYGPVGLGSIVPPNMALVFDITLVRVKSK